MPLGNWAEWAGAGAAGLSLIVLAIGLTREQSARRKADRDKVQEQRRRQASMVGGWVQPTDSTGQRWELFVVNSSDLPVRDVVGYVFHTPGQAATFGKIPVIAPHKTGAIIVTLPQPTGAVRLVIAFADEATHRWRKHMHAELEQIPRGSPDIEPGDTPRGW